MKKRYKDWLFLRRIRRQFRIGIALRDRCIPGSPEHLRMNNRLTRLASIIEEIEFQYAHGGIFEATD